MVRLADLHEAGRQSSKDLDCPVFDDKPFVAAGPVRKRKLAVISSAGLIRRGDAPFRGGDAGYREFDNSVDNRDILISHISINFDRTAAVQNIETVFPRETLKEMASAGEIGAVADTHYSFMGATDPLAMEENATRLASELRAAGVDSVVLLPV